MSLLDSIKKFTKNRSNSAVFTKKAQGILLLKTIQLMIKSNDDDDYIKI